MTHAMTLMKLLIDRGPLSAVQMVEASGLSLTQVRKAMQALRVRKAMLGMDRPYQITDEGRELARARERRTKRLAAKAAQPKRPMGRPRKAEPVVEIPDMPVVQRFIAAPVHADSVVAGAVRSRPALQAAWL